MTDDLSRIPEALRISRATVWVIRQNLVIALGTVAALRAGVMLGEVNMAAGMLVHEGSVLLVIANGMRLMRAGAADVESGKGRRAYPPSACLSQEENPEFRSSNGHRFDIVWSLTY